MGRSDVFVFAPFLVFGCIKLVKLLVMDIITVVGLESTVGEFRMPSRVAS